jgi:hypothetical protein
MHRHSGDDERYTITLSRHPLSRDRCVSKQAKAVQALEWVTLR